MGTEERIVALESRLAAAEGRLARLEGQTRRNGEVPTPMIPWNPSQSYGPNQCGKCGLKMEGVMGYVCPKGGNCPTGLGGFSCGISGAISRNTP